MLKKYKTDAEKAKCEAEKSKGDARSDAEKGLHESDKALQKQKRAELQKEMLRKLCLTLKRHNLGLGRILKKKKKCYLKYILECEICKDIGESLDILAKRMKKSYNFVKSVVI